MTTWPRGVRFRPIQRWPRELSTSRKSSPFRANWPTTLADFEHELRQLKAKNVVIQVAMGEQDIRLDGYPRADRRPSHPGVIVSMETEHGALSYPCDTFWDWTDNLRAIVLTLRNLRATDRYGVTKHGEQYTGWKQLGTGRAMPSMTESDAVAFIGQHAGATQEVISAMRDGRRDLIAPMYRAAARKLHPDAGGDPDLFARLQVAKRILDGAK